MLDGKIGREGKRGEGGIFKNIFASFLFSVLKFARGIFSPTSNRETVRLQVFGRYGWRASFNYEMSAMISCHHRVTRYGYRLKLADGTIRRPERGSLSTIAL